MDILATVQNLLRQGLQPSAFLRPLSKLFSFIHNKLPRKALTSVFQVRKRMKQSFGLSLHLFGLIMKKVVVISSGFFMYLISKMFYILDWNFTILCV